MGNIFYAQVTETATQIIDPVTDQIVDKVLRQYNLKDLINVNQSIINGRTATSLTQDKDGNPNMVNDRLVVTVDTNYNPTSQKWENYRDWNMPSTGMSRTYTPMREAILNDPSSGFSIREMTVPFGMTLKFSFQFTTYDTADLLLRALLDTTVGNQITGVQDLVFSYPISMSVLKAIHLVRSSSLDYKTKTDLDYIKDMVTTAYQVNVRREDLLIPQRALNPEVQYAFKRIQMNCPIKITCDMDRPETEYEGSAPNTFTVEFQYTIQFALPDLLQIILPPVVDNTLLPEPLFRNVTYGYLQSIAGLIQTSSFDTAIRLCSGDYGDGFLIRFPYYDTWNIPKGSLINRFSYNPLMTGIVLLDSTTTPTEIDLSNMGDIKLADFMVDILSQHTQSDILDYKALFNLTVFANDVPLRADQVTWDPTTLKLSFLGADISAIYRFVFSEATEIKRLDYKWFDVILKYRYFFPLTVMRCLDYFTKMGYYTITGGDRLVQLVGGLRNAYKLDDVIITMIKNGDTTGLTFQYTQTSEQFADYISNTPSLKPDMNRSLYTAFIEVCLSKGYITQQSIPPLYVKNSAGYAFGPHQGGFARFSLPLRVFDTTITTAK